MEQGMIKVDTVVLRETETGLQRILTSMQDIKKEISSIKNEDFWNTSASNRFKDASKNLIEKIEKLETNIEIRGEILKELAGVYEETEGKAEHTVKALSTENIF